MLKNSFLIIITILFFTSCSIKKPLTEINVIKEPIIETKYYDCIDKESDKSARLKINYKSNWGKDLKKLHTALQIKKQEVRNCKIITDIERTKSFNCYKTIDKKPLNKENFKSAEFMTLKITYNPQSDNSPKNQLEAYKKQYQLHECEEVENKRMLTN